MAHSYRNYSPDQGYLLAPDPLEWLPLDCLAYQVRDIVDELDLSVVHSAYSNDGRGAPAFAPQMMLCVLLYAYYKGVQSSRGVERLCTEDLGARYLTGGLIPDHRSINLFRLRHKAALKNFFKQSIHMCRAAGMAPLKLVAIDGTKIPGAASKDSSMKYERIIEEEKRLNDEIEAALQAGLDIDAAEDALFGADNNGFSLPDHLKSRQDRIAALRKAKAELETRARNRETARKEEWDRTDPKDRPHRKTPDPDNAVPEPDDRYNFVDPESRMMKGRGQWVQGYNAQASVDAAHGVIVGCGVTDDGTDYAQLVPMADQTEANTGEKPKKILADSGYYDHANIQDIEERGFSALVPPDKKGQHDKTAASPLTDAEQNKLTARELMHYKVTTEQGRADYAYRMKTVEPVFGQIKGSPGNPLFTRFLRRGLERAEQDWCFVCMAYNLRKLIRFRLKQNEEQNLRPQQASRRLRKPPMFKNMAMEGI